MIVLIYGINNFKMFYVLENEIEMKLECIVVLMNIINVFRCCFRIFVEIVWFIYCCYYYYYYLVELCCGII